MSSNCFLISTSPGSPQRPLNFSPDCRHSSIESLDFPRSFRKSYKHIKLFYNFLNTYSTILVNLSSVNCIHFLNPHSNNITITHLQFLKDKFFLSNFPNFQLILLVPFVVLVQLRCQHLVVPETIGYP